MKAIYPFGSHDFRLVDLPDPVPGVGEVLVAVKASGICGSDKWLWRVESPIERVFGHEVAGQVVAAGTGVEILRPGDRVAINNVVGCGQCPACRQGAYVSCLSWDGKHDVGGGFGTLVSAPERNCMLLADGVDYETGCLLFDNFGTPFNALSRVSIASGDGVVVSGLGPIGLAAVILARLRGAYVIGLDPLPYRREMAAGLGASVVAESNDEAPAVVREHTDGLGAAAVLECSGKAPAYPIGLRSLRHGGTLVTIGEGGQWDLRPSELLIRKQLSIVGSWYSSMRQGQELQSLVLAGKIEPRILVTHRGPLAEFPRLLRLVCECGERLVKAVLVNP